MRIIAAGFVALFITASPLAQPLAHAESGDYSGGYRHGPLPGQVFGHHHHRGAKAQARAVERERAYHPAPTH
jgi:hypothetical protein